MCGNGGCKPVPDHPLLLLLVLNLAVLWLYVARPEKLSGGTPVTLQYFSEVLVNMRVHTAVRANNRPFVTSIVLVSFSTHSILFFFVGFAPQVDWNWWLVFFPTWFVLFGQLVGYYVDYSLARSLSAGMEGKEEEELTQVCAAHDLSPSPALSRVPC